MISSPGGGGFGFYSDFLILDPGVLINVSGFTDATYLQATCTWCEIGIAAAPFSNATRHTCLIAAYITNESPLHWDGFYPIPDNSLLYLKVRGNLNPIINIFEHRLTPTFARRLKGLYHAITG